MYPGVCPSATNHIQNDTKNQEIKTACAIPNISREHNTSII
jgi:hypothetical protein